MVSARRRLALVTAAACLALGVGVSALASGGGPPAQYASPPIAPSPGQPTALLVKATNRPLRVPGSDGLQRLEYDLIVSNVFTAPVTLTSLEVRSDSGRTLLRLTGDDLATVTEGLLTQAPVTPPAQVPVSGSVAVMVDVAVPAGEVPSRLTNVIDYRSRRTRPRSPSSATPPARSRARSSPSTRASHWRSPRPCAATAGSASRAAAVWASPGCRPTAIAHRSLRYALDGNRIILAETFAIDFVQLRDGSISRATATASTSTPTSARTSWRWPTGRSSSPATICRTRRRISRRST
jgi:hypothetical protein